MIRVLKYSLYLSIVIVCILGFFLPHEHGHGYFWEKIPIFDAIYGFIGCIVLIIFSKALGHHWLEKKEDYYD